MASLVIVPKTIEGFLIDVSLGRYEFGISLVNNPEIILESYQLSNRFDNLVVGRYYWSIRDRFTYQVKFQGYNDVLPVDGAGICKTFFVNKIDNLKEIFVPYSYHGKSKVSDIICYEWVDNKYEMFLPSTIFVREDLTVNVSVSEPFTGKIEIC